jgi:glycosyltransferase involved in cell wall biosynthesis
MSKKVLYIAPIVNNVIKDQYEISNYSRAGNNKSYGIIESLQTKQMELTVVSPISRDINGYYSKKQSANDPELGFEYHIPPIFNINRLGKLLLGIMTTLTVLKLLCKKRFDAIIFYNIRLQTALPALAARWTFFVPLILQYEDGYISDDIHWVIKLLWWVTNRSLDGAICVNTVLESKLRTENTKIIRGFPSIGMPSDLPSSPSKHESLIIMYAGRFDRVRGVDLFISIAEKLLNRGISAQFWISGYGEDKQYKRVKRKVKRCKKDVRFFGTLPFEKYIKKLVAADILVNPQNPEQPISQVTFPSKLLDFMSSGSIVVSTDMADISDTLDEQVIIGGKTSQTMADTIEYVCSDPEYFKQEYEQSALEWVENNCSYELVGSKINKIIEGSK